MSKYTCAAGLSISIGLWVACGGPQPPAEPSAPRCDADTQCEDRLRDHCPGGSSTFARCVDGQCIFEGCSSPIGTPCDDDPSTVFEGEHCE